MAEKAEKKAEAAPAAAHGEKDKKAGGGLLAKTPVLVGGAMVIEAVVLLLGIWIFRGSAPKAADAGPIAGVTKTGEGDAAAAAEPDEKRAVEVPVVEFRALNRRSGHTFLYDVTIVATTKAKFEKQVKDKIADCGNLIRDRIRTIIAESDPEKLGGGSEPGLETLRRQVKYQLDEIIGEGQVDEVLVPKCIPYRADF